MLNELLNLSSLKTIVALLRRFNSLYFNKHGVYLQPFKPYPNHHIQIAYNPCKAVDPKIQEIGLG